MLTLVVDDGQLAPIRTACIEIFTGRQCHAWPPAVRVWPAWPTIYAAAASTLGVDVLPEVERAAEWLRTLINTIDNSTQ